MKDRGKTKKQLMGELVELRERVAALEPLESEHLRTGDALRQRTADLLASHKKLDTFTRTLSSDLREPLGLVVSFAQMLEKDYAALSDEELHHYLQAIAQRGREIVDVVDRLLAIPTGPTKEIEEGTGPLDMAGIVIGVMERLTYMVDEYQAKVVQPESWPVALGHGPWIEEVWANLISNAIKYGGRPPHVELGATEQEDGTVRFWVRDNGNGLAPEEQVRLLARSDQSPATEYGLGLMLVQRIMRKTGGQVGVESEVGQGSVFFFTLPVAE